MGKITHRIPCKVFIQVCCNIENILLICAEAAFISKLTVRGAEQRRELYLLCCGRQDHSSHTRQ